MGVDTKGVVATSVKDAFTASILIENGLSKLIKDSFNIIKENCASDAEARKEWLRQDESGFRLWSAPTIDFSPSTCSMRVNFALAGERRSMSLFYRCDSDNLDISKQSLSLMLGCGGNSSAMMKAALLSLSPLGPVYFKSNDATEDFVRLNFLRPSLLGLVKVGILKPHDLNHLADGYRHNPYVFDTSFEDFFGIGEARLDRICSLSYEQRNAEFLKIADAVECSSFKSAWDSVQAEINNSLIASMKDQERILDRSDLCRG